MTATCQQYLRISQSREKQVTGCRSPALVWRVWRCGTSLGRPPRRVRAAHQTAHTDPTLQPLTAAAHAQKHESNTGRPQRLCTVRMHVMMQLQYYNPAGDVTVGGNHASTHVGVDVLEGPNAVVIIAQKDLGMEGDVSFDTVGIAIAVQWRIGAAPQQWMRHSVSARKDAHC